MPLSEPEWRDRLKLSSVPIRRFDTADKVAGACSGCIVYYKGARFLLTVAHAVEKPGRWAVEDRFDPARGETRLYGLGQVNFLAVGSLENSDVRRVDFAYARLPDDFVPLYQEITRWGISNQSPRLEIPSALDALPDPEVKLGFCAQANMKVVGDGSIIDAEQPMEVNLTYLRTEGDMYVFDLNHAHPGHDYYKGSSGAPILDRNGNLIALVVRGDDTNNTIYGIRLQQYRIALDIDFFEDRIGQTDT